MPKIRVLVVDDSFFMRKLLRELFKEDRDIEIVGEAKDGAEAVEMAGKLKPDVITMDYNMPTRNGAEATEAIMKGEEPLPKIIMLSAATKKGADETMRCLSAGAVDFVTKPSGELSLDIEKVKAELIFKVKLVARAKIRKRERQEETKKDKIIPVRLNGEARLVVIGSSTGGPPAVEEILTNLPGDMNAAILVVQHMPEHFTKSFAERLDRISRFHTKEGEDGDEIKTGICLVAPGNYHMVVKKNNRQRIVKMNQDPPRFGLRPAIDITMKSAAENFPGGVLGIILTGMGQDGTEGMRAIKEIGGYTIAQSPETAVIDSMPSSVIKSGLADEIVPLHDIAKRIIELSK